MPKNLPGTIPRTRDFLNGHGHRFGGGGSQSPCLEGHREYILVDVSPASMPACCRRASVQSISAPTIIATGTTSGPRRGCVPLPPCYAMPARIESPKDGQRRQHGHHAVRTHPRRVHARKRRDRRALGGDWRGGAPVMDFNVAGYERVTLNGDAMSGFIRKRTDASSVSSVSGTAL
jgi:hypothetical protein